MKNLDSHHTCDSQIHLCCHVKIGTKEYEFYSRFITSEDRLANQNLKSHLKLFIDLN